jgi:hypothetical protein
MDQLTGRADVYVNGAYAETTQEGSSISTLGGIENTPVINSRGQTSGYTTKAVSAQIKAVFTHGPDFDISVYNSGLPTTLDFLCDNGVVYQMADAIFTKDEGLDANKGTVTITFSGDIERV